MAMSVYDILALKPSIKIKINQQCIKDPNIFLYALDIESVNFEKLKKRWESYSCQPGTGRVSVLTTTFSYRKQSYKHQFGEQN